MALAIAALAVSPMHAELIGNWSFDEGTGTTTADLTGNGYEAAITNGASPNAGWIAGKVGSGAYSFWGGTYAVVDEVNAFTPTADAYNGGNGGDYTVSLWMQLKADYIVTQRLLSTDDGFDTTGGWSPWLNPGGAGNSTLGQTHNSNGGYTWQPGWNASTYMDVWKQVTLTYDHTTQLRKLYVDGALEATSAAAPPLTSDGDDPFVMGAFRSNGGAFAQFYYGYMDDVAFWNSSLDDTQVAAITNLANSALNYGALQADSLFNGFGAQQPVTIDGKTWAYAPSGIDGVNGDVNDLGGGNYSINLGDGAGMVTVIPEPSTLALLAAGMLGMLVYAWRKRK